MDKSTTRICTICHSPLILVSQVTSQVEGSRFFQTNSIYRCSNQECQDEKDKQTEKRIKLQKEKEAAIEKRNEEKLQKKLALKGGIEDGK